MHCVKTLRTGRKQLTTANSWAAANLILFIQNLIYVCHLFTGPLKQYRITSKLLLRIQGCFKCICLETWSICICFSLYFFISSELQRYCSWKIGHVLCRNFVLFFFNLQCAWSHHVEYFGAVAVETWNGPICAAVVESYPLLTSLATEPGSASSLNVGCDFIGTFQDF